jgi:hypothetical protein
MASTLNPKQMAKIAFRLAVGAQFALLAAAGCSSSDTPPARTSCGAVAQCPAGQGCLNNVCTPFQNGSAGNTANPGAAGNTANPGAAGNTTNPGGAGASGAIGNPGGGSGNATSAAGATGSSAGAGPMGNAGAAGSNTTAGAGYWTSKDWHGCSWTGKGTAGTTTITPADFTTKAAGMPYCISGSVGNTNESVALLGFNVAEPTSASCVAKPADTTALGPPGVVPTANGIAVDFVKKGANTAFTFRVQIQGPNGAMAGTVGESDRWCATVSEVSGKVFVPWTAFTPKCWAAAGSQGTPYAKQPISAVVFTVPGTMSAATPYDVCVNGLAYGTTAADAPDGTAVQGDLTGTIGEGTTMAADFQRVKVKADGKEYIIQNNNWGNPDGSNQTLSYKNNSFKITATTGSGQSAPASFPSIYIGNNGNTANGVFSTKGDATKPGDGLPALISTITSIPSTFRYSPAITSEAINAAYDIWFAKNIPTAEYQDGIDGFVMIWLRNPKDKHPIGFENGKAGTETIAGQAWDVYKGPRGAGPAGNNSAPVISFVNPANDDSRAQTFVNVDIKKFIDIATMSKYGLPANVYLTDVFAGFEIWDGGASKNLSVDEFKCVVNK